MNTVGKHRVGGYVSPWTPLVSIVLVDMLAHEHRWLASCWWIC